MMRYKSYILAATISIGALAPSLAFAAQPSPLTPEIQAPDVLPEADKTPDFDEQENPADYLKEDKLHETLRLFEKLLGLDHLPPIDESRLPVAQQLSNLIISPQSVQFMLETAYGPMRKSVSNEIIKLGSADLSAALNLTRAQEARVGEKELQAIGQLLDPHKDVREARITAMFEPLVADVIEVTTPRLQDGQAKAWARRFPVEQLEDIRNFFQTPSGAAYAQQLLALSVDGEITRAVIHSVPDIITRVKARTPAITAEIASLPLPQDVDNLSDAQLREVARILRIDFKQLKAQAVQARADRVEISMADDAIQMVPESYDRDNWSTEKRVKVEALEAAVADAQRAVSDAETEAIEDANTRLGIGNSKPPITT